MTPGARVQAAIECLDAILGGAATEQVLTRWARNARYAGSKDRAAVRDHVYHVLRRKRSCAAHGGGSDARALMIGATRLQGGDVDEIFSGIGHAPAALSDAERQAGEMPAAHLPELPDWLLPLLEDTYGIELEQELEQLTRRACVFLRVNLRKGEIPAAQAILREDGVETRCHDLAKGALLVTDGMRRVAMSRAYREGFVELQDAASQAAMETLPLRNHMKVLDFCAGGGGKTLALAGRADGVFFAHDANPARMHDLPARAKRAGVEVRLLETAQLAGQGPYDLVLCDVPCSGSGTWRRDPDAKWRFLPSRLAELNAVQDEILDAAAPLVAKGGVLAYATCSLLREENGERIDSFLSRNPEWRSDFRKQWHLSQGADGFFIAHLTRAN